MTLFEALLPHGMAVSKLYGVMVVRHAWGNRYTTGEYYRVHHFSGLTTKHATLEEVLQVVTVPPMAWQAA